MTDFNSDFNGIAAMLSRTNKILLLGVGGGNDSVTLLILLEQLRAAYAMHPTQVDVAAMLPDFLEYQGYCETEMDHVWEVTPQTQRFMQGVNITGFPEPLLAQNVTRFGIGHVWGLDMHAGSEGIAKALIALVRTHAYDLILACDVGGDFITVAENYDVLSPMMDAYALYGLRQLQALHPTLPLLGAVFGLGTDGESSPDILRRALRSVGQYQEGTFAPDIALDVEAFYRKEIEPKRYSRTADFTLQQIRAVLVHNCRENYRVRYHSHPESTRWRSYTGNFEHTLDPQFYGKYYLFTDFSGIENPFAIRCTSAVDWLLTITEGAAGSERVHHEMVGQRLSYQGFEVLCSVSSRKFTPEKRKAIFTDAVSSVCTGVYDAAFVYSADIHAYAPEARRRLSVVVANSYVSCLHRPDCVLRLP